MKEISLRYGRLVLGMVGAALLVSGCTTYVPSHSVTPSSVSAKRTGKDTETEAFTKGMHAFYAGQYSNAAAHFRNVIATFPGSPLLVEAQWYLGRSYIAAGEKDRAIRELTLLLKNDRKGQYGKEARLLLSQMEFGLNKVIATLWSPNTTPRLRDHLHRVNHPGINTVIITLPDKQLEQIGFAPSPVRASDSLTVWIDAARKENLRVIVRVPLRTLQWPKNPYGHDFSDAQKQLDLFHPEVKAWLRTLSRNIAQYPIDGIYVDQIAHGIGEGETGSARILYENLFLEKLPLTPASAVGDLKSYPSQSWRFAGLKSRYMTELLEDLRAAVQAVRPPMAFGVSVPEMLLTDPQDGLVYASLDYVQLKAAQFDFYVITQRGAPKETVYASLRKYGALEKTWLEESDPWGKDEAHVPIQGIVLK